MAQGPTVVIREFDGGRGVELQQVGDFMILETGYHAFAFDAGLFRHAIKRALGISVILDHDEGVAMP